jgi:hypothetical protein
VVTRQSPDIIGRPQTIDDFPEFAKLLAQDYRPVERFRGVTIYEAGRLAPSQPPRSPIA